MAALKIESFPCNHSNNFFKNIVIGHAGRDFDFEAYTHFCRIRDGGGAPPLPPIIFEERNCSQQTIHHWKGNLSESGSF